MKRYNITVGAQTTVGGTVVSGWHRGRINGQAIAREGDEVKCPECDSTGTIVCVGPRLSEQWDGRKPALDGDLCKCKCDPPPKLIANQTMRSQQIDVGNVAPPARAAAQPASPGQARQPTVESHPSSFTSPPSPTTSYSELPGLVCQNLWRGYQQRAEAVVAPGGVLIADPKTRNRAINAAYASMWLEDQRFQWAGLAAFASKQVGCGLLHAAESIEKIDAQKEAKQRRVEAHRKKPAGLFGWFSKSERQTTARELEQAERDYEQARRNNPTWWLDVRSPSEPLSLVQKQLLFVHDMLALGNTTLFLDVFPLHAFYKERGLGALKTCLESRQKIYGHDQYPVIWPIKQEKLKFGYDHKEILQAFEAIEAGNIVESVVFLAEHEQKNILQPAMYSDLDLVTLLRRNHFSYVTNLPSGAAAAVELTLTSQCRPSEDGRTVDFSSDYFANLADIHQRMPFVLNAATQFDELLRRSDRHLIEQAILDIATGRGVR
jgi:uncharacterized Zn-binding protein involved in type VI secretion